MSRVAIATVNKGKLEAATNGFAEYYGADFNGFDFSTLSVPSGVSDTPLSDDEGLLGCENRLTALEVALPGMDMYVALEGVLATAQSRWYVRGWTMIKDAERNRLVTASGASVQVPLIIGGQIDAADQFSENVAAHYAVTPEEAATIRDIGANGVFSDGEYTRLNTFNDGVRICLAQLDNDRNWD